jgi:hypothetical protein
MLDRPIIRCFKMLADERGYQTPISETLRQSMDANHWEPTCVSSSGGELATSRQAANKPLG